MNVFKLRKLLQIGRFEAEFESLDEDEQERVLGVLRKLRTDAQLPGPDDIDELIPPCVPGGWRRRVPNTNLWVYYDFYGIGDSAASGDDIVTVRTVRVPRVLSEAALDALEEDLSKPPPIPYLRPVPDLASAPDDSEGDSGE